MYRSDSDYLTKLFLFAGKQCEIIDETLKLHINVIEPSQHIFNHHK